MNRSYRGRYCNYNYTDDPQNIIENTCNCVDNNLFMEQNMCECGFTEDNLFPLNPEFGQSYVPHQFLQKTFIPSVGLEKGTLFPELYSPYEPCQSVAEIAYLKNSNEIKGGCNDERV